MSPEAFETILIEKVNSLGMVAVPYPENPRNYYPENSPGEVLVRYEGRKVINRDLAGPCNRVRLYAELVVVSRQLRGDDGAYLWLEQLWRALEGYAPDGAGPLHMEVESFMDEDAGTWQFGQKWSCEVNEWIELTDNYGDDHLGTD